MKGYHDGLWKLAGEGSRVIPREGWYCETSQSESSKYRKTNCTIVLSYIIFATSNAKRSLIHASDFVTLKRRNFHV